MNLFNKYYINNILPNDGTVSYYQNIIKSDKADKYYDLLLKNICWKNDEVIVFGKHIITKRKIAWYGDSNLVYTYSNVSRQTLEWTRELLELKKMVEDSTETKFNSCLLNLYEDGSSGISWHSDNEKSLGKNIIIASLSFGAERRFSFKHKQNKQIISVILEHGSLLVMKDQTQDYWLHSLPKCKTITKPRINLTFRTIKCRK